MSVLNFEQVQKIYGMPRAMQAARRPHVSGLKYLIRLRNCEAIAFSHWSYADHPACEWVTLYEPENVTTRHDVGEMLDVRLDQVVTCGLSAIPLRSAWVDYERN